MIPMLAAGDTLLMILLFAGPLLAVYGIFQLVTELRASPKKKLADRLKGRVAADASRGGVTSFNDLLRQTPQARGKLAEMLTNLKLVERLQTTLEQANVNLAASALLINITLVACILVAVILVLGLPLLAGLGLAVLCYLGPLFFLYWRRKARLNKMVLQLPDVFEMLSQALRAGHSLASGMQLISREMPEPAGTEFARVFHEHNLGLKLEDALQNLATRMDILDVRFFVTAVLIQRQTGGDLAEVLDKISSVIRDRIKLFGTVKALTAEGRLSGYILLALPVVVFVAMLRINYDYAAVLLNHPTGQMMGMAAIVMMVCGWVMIKWIVNIKV